MKQVHKPLSGSVTEESDDDSDAKVFEGTDKVQTQETNSTHFSLKENKKLEETSDDESEDSGIPKSMESPSIAIKVPDVPSKNNKNLLQRFNNVFLLKLQSTRSQIDILGVVVAYPGFCF